MPAPRSRRVVWSLLVVVSLALAACGRTQSTEQPDPRGFVGVETGRPRARLAARGAWGGRHEFVPATIVVPPRSAPARQHPQRHAPHCERRDLAWSQGRLDRVTIRLSPALSSVERGALSRHDVCDSPGEQQCERSDGDG